MGWKSSCVKSAKPAPRQLINIQQLHHEATYSSEWQWQITWCTLITAVRGTRETENTGGNCNKWLLWGSRQEKIMSWCTSAAILAVIIYYRCTIINTRPRCMAVAWWRYVQCAYGPTGYSDWMDAVLCGCGADVD